MVGRGGVWLRVGSWGDGCLWIGDGCGVGIVLLLQILIQSICETMVPKLVSEDIPLLYSLLSDVFPGVLQVKNKMKQLRDEIATVCKEMHLVYGEGDEQGALWVEKVWMYVLVKYYMRNAHVLSFISVSSCMYEDS